MSSPTESINRFFHTALRLNHLRTLAALLSLGQIRKVAETFHVTQSAISKQIAEIESALGEEVVRRLGNSLVLTPIGELLAVRAKEILLQLDRARDDIIAIRGGLGGHVALGTVSTVNSTLVPSAILHIKQRAPNVVVSIEEDTADRLMSRLRDRDIDLAIVRMWHPVAHETLAQKLLMNEDLVLVTSTRHPLAHKMIDWEDTMDFPWVVPRAGSTAHSALEALLAVRNLHIPPGHTETISLALISQLLASDLFIGLLPRQLATIWVNEGRIAVLPLDTQNLLSEVRVFWRADDDNPTRHLVLDCLVHASAQA